MVSIDIPFHIIQKHICTAPDLRLVSKHLKELHDDDCHSYFTINGENVRNNCLPNLTPEDMLIMVRRFPLKFENYGLSNTLTTFIADGMKLKNLSFLKGCRALLHLRLNFNQLTDLSGLSEFPNLRQLDVTHNDIKDVSGLSGCTALKFLDISFNDFIAQDMPEMPELECLSISKACNLKNLKQLKDMVVHDAATSMLNELAECHELETLSFGASSANIDDISCLSHLPLTHLNIVSTGVQKIPKFEQLLEVIVPPLFQDLEGLNACPKLVMVQVIEIV